MKLKFYKLDIAEHIKNTLFLSYSEEGIYIRLCHLYFETRTPLPKNIENLCYKIRVRNCDHARKKIEEVLKKTFVETEKGYVNLEYLAKIKAIKGKRKESDC